MPRLLSLLLMFALVLTNGAAVASAMCQHVDAQAHARAKQSSYEAVAAVALSEEAAAVSTRMKVSLADAASVQLAGFIVPAEPFLPQPYSLEPARELAAEPLALPTLAVRPLLEPPLA